MKLKKLLMEKFGHFSIEAAMQLCIARNACQDGLDFLEECRSVEEALELAPMEFLTWFAAPYLDGADLSGDSLRDDSELLNINFARANLRAANLSYTNLHLANFQNADLRWANLEGADLSDADLEGADLRWANLSGADLRWAFLFGANLESTNLE